MLLSISPWYEAAILMARNLSFALGGMG